MAGMLMLSGVGKMNFKKAVLVGALKGACGYEKQGAYVYENGGPTYKVVFAFGSCILL
jgi:hypothetical protein